MFSNKGYEKGRMQMKVPVECVRLQNYYFRTRQEQWWGLTTWLVGCVEVRAKESWSVSVSPVRVT